MDSGGKKENKDEDKKEKKPPGGSSPLRRSPTFRNLSSYRNSRETIHLPPPSLPNNSSSSQRSSASSLPRSHQSENILSYRESSSEEPSSGPLQRISVSEYLLSSRTEPSPEPSEPPLLPRAIEIILGVKIQYQEEKGGSVKYITIGEYTYRYKDPYKDTPAGHTRDMRIRRLKMHQLKDIIDEEGTDFLNERDSSEKTALIYAIKQKDLAFVTFLLRYNAVIPSDNKLLNFLARQDQKDPRVQYCLGVIAQQNARTPNLSSAEQTNLLSRAGAFYLDAVTRYKPTYERLAQVFNLLGEKALENRCKQFMWENLRKYTEAQARIEAMEKRAEEKALAEEMKKRKFLAGFASSSQSSRALLPLPRPGMTGSPPSDDKGVQSPPDHTEIPSRSRIPRLFSPPPPLPMPRRAMTKSPGSGDEGVQAPPPLLPADCVIKRRIPPPLSPPSPFLPHAPLSPRSPRPVPRPTRAKSPCSVSENAQSQTSPPPGEHVAITIRSRTEPRGLGKKK